MLYGRLLLCGVTVCVEGWRGLQKLFRSRKNSSFSTGCVDRIALSKKRRSKRHFFNSVRQPDFVPDRKPAFSIHVSDWTTISLTLVPAASFISTRIDASTSFGNWAQTLWMKANAGIHGIVECLWPYGVVKVGARCWQWNVQALLGQQAHTCTQHRR